MEAIDTVRELVVALRSRPVAMVCIDGLGGSGKTTLAAQLAGDVAAVVHADDFYGPEELDWWEWSPAQGYERYFDHDRLESELLVPLHEGRVARYQRYDWTQHRLDGTAVIHPTGIVLVEGVYLLKPKLRQYWDLSIWVDTPREVALARCYDRGENDPGWIQRWAAAEDLYVGRAAPRDAADLTVSGR